MGDHDSRGPPPARRFVLRKIARPVVFPASALPPAGLPPSPVHPPPSRPSSNPSRFAGATIKPPPPIRKPAPSSAHLSARVEEGQDIAGSAISPRPVEGASAYSARGSIPPVAATLPPSLFSATSATPPSTRRRKWALAAVPGLTLVLAIAAIGLNQRDSAPGLTTSTAAGGIPKTVLSEMPEPVTPPATAHTAASIDLLPEAPVEALPKAATIAKPIGGVRRLAPAAALPAAPTAHPRVVGPAFASGQVPDPGEVSTAAPTTGNPDSEQHEDPPIAPNVPPPIDALVKAIHDDIEEDEARHK
jgi:hypothetical protein